MKNNKINSILITGCNGLLGRDLCEKLSKSNLDLYGLVHNNLYTPIKNVRYIIKDLSNLNNLDKLPKKIDCIVHLAQSSNFRKFPEFSQDIFNVNVSSTAFLLEYARKINVKKFIYASSGGIYGKGPSSFDENASIVPIGDLGFYLGTKTCGEIIVQSYASIFEVNIIRPFFIYGKYQNRSMLIPRIMDSISNGKAITIQNNQGIRINPINVDDASNSVIALLEKNSSSIFNIAGPEILSIFEIAETMADFLQKKPIYKNIAGPSYDIIADITLMKKELKVPTKTLKQSLHEIAPKN